MTSPIRRPGAPKPKPKPLPGKPRVNPKAVSKPKPRKKAAPMNGRSLLSSLEIARKRQANPPPKGKALKARRKRRASVVARKVSLKGVTSYDQIRRRQGSLAKQRSRIDRGDT